MGKEILIYAIMGALGFVGWLLKQSIYGRLDRMESQIKENSENKYKIIEKIKSDYMTASVCSVSRLGCQQLLISKMDALSDLVEMIITNQEHLIERFEAHINGTGNK